jgi:hypothetical protein
MIMAERQTMDNGVPDCPECGGKGMCDKHKCEYLEWVYKTAYDEYRAALKEYKEKLEERIKQDEQARN